MNLIRQIDNEVKPHWDQIKNAKNPPNFKDDCSPLLLRGWTDENPSLWEVDHPNKPDLKRILVALCRRKKKDWEKIAYLLFDKSAIDKAKLSITQTNGNTGDSAIDISKTHYEIKGVTAKELCVLIYNIMTSKFEVNYFKKTDYELIILSAYDQVQISVLSRSETVSVSSTSTPAVSDTTPRENVSNTTNIEKSFKSPSESVEFVSEKSSAKTSHTTNKTYTET